MLSTAISTPGKKGFRRDLTVVGKTSSCSCRTGIDYPKLPMEEEEEEEATISPWAHLAKQNCIEEEIKCRHKAGNS
jgi:hypothetical protein